MASRGSRPSTPPVRPILHDSPFSDYYSDSAFSAAPAQTTKIQSALLNRLSQLAVQVTREEPVEPVAYHVQRALDNLYALFAVPDTQTRQPAELEDSGLFIEDDSPRLQQKGFARDSHDAALDEDRDYDDDELDDVYGTMIKMSMELREGFLEMKGNQTGLVAEMTQVKNQSDALKSENRSLRSQNDILQAQVAALRSKIEGLRSQNQSLRTDLQSDFTELMSLKLQLMAIEVKSALHLGRDGSEVLKHSMERWTEEWHDMDEKFRERREKFSSAVDPNLLGEAHQLAADISAFLNLEDGNLKPKSSRHARNVPGGHFRGSSDPLPILPSSIQEESAEEAEADEVDEAAEDAAHPDSKEQAELQTEAVVDSAQQTPAQKPATSFFSSLWRSAPKQLSIPRSLLADPRKGIWDALSDVTGVGMYDDFYDDYRTTD